MLASDLEGFLAGAGGAEAFLSSPLITINTGRHGLRGAANRAAAFSIWPRREERHKGVREQKIYGDEDEEGPLRHKKYCEK